MQRNELNLVESSAVPSFLFKLKGHRLEMLFALICCSNERNFRNHYPILETFVDMNMPPS